MDLKLKSQGRKAGISLFFYDKSKRTKLWSTNLVYNMTNLCISDFGSKMSEV